MDNRPIGVFDSGVGGVTVLKELKKMLPFEDFIYFGDTARVPYGTKSMRTITAFAVQIVEFLLKKNVKLIVAACNTVSSNSLSFLKKKYHLPIIGVIEPGVDLAYSLSQNKKIGIIGTQSTIASHKYKNLLLKKDRSLNIIEKACPLFVPLVEEGLINNKITDEAIAYYLTSLKKKNIDILILGCTHYPLLRRPLEKFFRSKVQLINSGYAVSLNVKKILESRQLLAKRNRKGKVRFYISDLTTDFLNVARPALGLYLLNPKVISLDS